MKFQAIQIEDVGRDGGIDCGQTCASQQQIEFFHTQHTHESFINFHTKQRINNSKRIRRIDAEMQFKDTN